jgi:SAM-dependent methyltransferase
VAYNAQRTIAGVIRRIPAGLARDLDVELLLIDDCSQDGTVARCTELHDSGGAPYRLNVLSNPVNQGYGGNQKIGYHYALREGFDYVALLHGDGQYAPECLPDMLVPLLDGRADAVFGSRMLTRGAARRGGMPLYKFVGNRILTFLQNRLLGSTLSEFHSGYRLYSTAALRAVPFNLNSQDFHFDTEIIIQLMIARKRIVELPIPTYYGDEICHVNGLGYAWNVMQQTAIARCQRLSILYDRKYDCAPDPGTDRYRTKLAFSSPHSAVLEVVPPGARVLDLGCGAGEVGAALRAKGCHVTGVDIRPPAGVENLDAFEQADLNDPSYQPDFNGCDHVLMLDVLEHLSDPEDVLDRLFDPGRRVPALTLIVSTGNVAFIVTRLMLLIGQFNYGKTGILDLTHRRLFTLRSLTRLLEQSGFEVVAKRGIPAPIPLALGDNALSRFLVALNRLAIRVARGLFSFQLLVIARRRPSLAYLLEAAHEPAVALRATAREAYFGK